jgi:hypothetical protein
MGWQLDHQLGHLIAAGVYLFLLALVVAFVCGIGVFWFRLFSALDRLATPNFYEASRLYPVPKKFRGLGGWKKGYLRDKWFCLCWIKACEEGVLVSKRAAWLRRPRILVPWNAFSNPKVFTLPWYASLLGTNFIDVQVENVPLNIIVGEDIWHFYPGVDKAIEGWHG